jgi:hypothetical protein
MNFIEDPPRMPEASTYLVRPKGGFFADIDARALAAG